MSGSTAVIGPTWLGAAPSVRDRVVLLAPHPDDEVLGTGALLRWLHGEGVATSVVAVTDGEASHRRSTRITRAELRRVRAAERDAALAALGVDPVVTRLGFPDGAVARHERALASALAELIDDTTTVVSPWRHDGHPDHDAVGRAALVVATDRGAAMWEAAIWSKVRPPTTGHRDRGLSPDPATDRAKRAAASCYRSQLHALGPTAEDGPVLHPHELAALLDGPEPVWVA